MARSFMLCPQIPAFSAQSVFFSFFLSAHRLQNQVAVDQPDNSCNAASDAHHMNATVSVLMR